MLETTVRMALQSGEIVNLIVGFTTPAGNGQDGAAYALAPSGELMKTTDVPNEAVACRWKPTGICGLENAVSFLLAGANWWRPYAAQKRLREWEESRQKANAP